MCPSGDTCEGENEGCDADGNCNCIDGFIRDQTGTCIPGKIIATEWWGTSHPLYNKVVWLSKHKLCQLNNCVIAKQNCKDYIIYTFWDPSSSCVVSKTTVL